MELRFNCPLPHGLHARPASMLAALAGQYGSGCVLKSLRTGASAEADSVLDLISLGVLHNDPCCLLISGEDEVAACAALEEFIASVLPQCDVLDEEPRQQRPGGRPKVLEGEAVNCIGGTAASPGIGIGILVTHRGVRFPVRLPDQPHTEPVLETQRLSAAWSEVLARMQALASTAASIAASEVAQATIAIMKDRSFSRLLSDSVAGGSTAAQAVVAAITETCRRLESTGSRYLAERVVDLQDIGLQLLAALNVEPEAEAAPVLSEPSVVAAQSMSPRQLLELDRSLLQGLILHQVGQTAHVVIIARSLGIPVIAGIDPLGTLLAGQECVIDAGRGIILQPVTQAVRRYYAREQQSHGLRHARLAAFKAATAQTVDGVRIEVAANISSPAEARNAYEMGADGVGLYRTEILLAERSAPPTEDEQFEAYRDAVLAMQGRPVIIRTFDIGGDKQIEYLQLPQEQNPFLGCRGIRLYPQLAELLKTQLRAILRAAHYGPLSVMAPMVTTCEEASWFKQQVEQAYADLDLQGVAYGAQIPIGIMLEVPSAMLMTEQLGRIVQFFSIGSNDLYQYTLAVDRSNPNVAGQYSALQPGFFKLLAAGAAGARAGGSWLGLCGELAGNLDLLPLLVGLGVNELSMSAARIPEVKRALSRLDSGTCHQLAQRAVGCATAEDVAQLLDSNSGSTHSLKLLEEDLIRVDADCSSKAEAIKELCDMLYIAERTDNADAIEAAVWLREQTYSTGLGFGFAIPHCKTSALRADSMAVLKLREPVEWEALDAQPVSLVILLATQDAEAGNVHLRTFAQLSRKLMDENFRQALFSAESATSIMHILTSELDLN